MEISAIIYIHKEIRVEKGADSEVSSPTLIVYYIGVYEQELNDTCLLESKRLVSFQNLLQAIANGNTIADVPSSLASHMALRELQLDESEHAAMTDAANGWN